jgi:hypothetical protein
MGGLGFNLWQEAVLQTLTADVIKSSEIEGEKLDAAQVWSSIATLLGLGVWWLVFLTRFEVKPQFCALAGRAGHRTANLSSAEHDPKRFHACRVGFRFLVFLQ